MGKIFCIIGKSSTGKDTIFQKLLERKELGLLNIVSYTTRPIRKGEVEGMEYFFCDENRRKELEKAGKIIESRTYDTRHGLWTYFTADDGQVDLSAHNYLIIGTLESYEKLRDYYTKDRLVPIYIEVEDGVRLERALKREQSQKTPRYEEMCRRFLSDARDFSPERRKAAGVIRSFVNEDVEETTEEIARYIADIIEGETHGY